MRVSEENYYINPNITQESTKRRGKTIFAGELNRPQNLFSKQGPFGNRQEDNAIERRREEAVKQAVKLVTDTWAGESAVDDSIGQTKERMQALEKESSELIQTRKGYQEQIAEYENDQNLTAEEKEAATATLYEAVEAADQELAGNAGALAAGQRSMEETKLERLKEHPMVDAVTEEQKALKAAARDAAFSMLQEGVNNIDEKIEEVVEAAQEKKEQADEEKKAEETGVSKENGTAQSQNTSSSKLTEQQQKVNSQLDKIRRENILTKDDMLGMLVDSRV
mgnify:CR=1 FL=1